MKKIGAALNAQGYSHHTEHLAPLCVLMDIPLLFGDETNYLEAKKLYPHLKAELREWSSFAPDALAKEYDVLYTSDQWPRDKLKQAFAPFNKTMRHVHCPHGFSDKAFWLKECAFEDMTLIYGQNMLDMLKREDVLKEIGHYVITGNLRFTYYLQNKIAFDKIVQDEILSRFAKKQPIILYAPTWQDSEMSSSFFSAIEVIANDLPDNYNLIVKLHPNLMQNDIVETMRCIALYDGRPNVVFIEEFPLVYPLLDKADIYLGDRSSIGYDFLAFNRPLFFLNETGKEELLFKCGTEIKKENYKKIYDVIEKEVKESQHFEKIRKEMYEYTFAQDKKWDEVKKEIDEKIHITG